MTATIHKWLLKFKCYLITMKYNFKLSVLAALATFQVFDSHMWPVATISDSTELNIFIISDSSVGQACLLWHRGVSGVGLSDALATRKLGLGV